MFTQVDVGGGDFGYEPEHAQADLVVLLLLEVQETFLLEVVEPVQKQFIYNRQIHKILGKLDSVVINKSVVLSLRSCRDKIADFGTKFRMAQNNIQMNKILGKLIKTC